MSRLAIRLASRELAAALRGGVVGLRVVLACLALGVAAIAGVGTLRAAIDAGIAADGRAILGGDLSIETGSEKAPLAVRDWLVARGARLSAVTGLRTMLVAPNGERQLVALRAVDGVWPLVGAPTIDPPQPVARALANGGLLVEPIVLQRLGVHVGDTLRLGETQVTLRGALLSEPDRATGTELFGAAALIDGATLPKTGLLGPGAIDEHSLRVALPPGTNVAATRTALIAAFAGQGLRVRDTSQAAPGVGRFIDQTTLFLTLAGLTALLVGGIGVGTGVRAWMDGRAHTVATLRCLGASSGLVLAVFLLQVMALAVLAIVVGVVVGAALPSALIGLFGAALPAPPRLGVYPAPLVLAAAYGLLTAGAFALWPLGRAARIPGAALFRAAALAAPGGRPATLVLLSVALLAAGLVAVTVLSAEDQRFALGFCAAVGVTLAAFRAGGTGLVLLARRLPRPRSAALRLGLANLGRPGGEAALMLVAVGVGLSTLATVALIEGNVRRAVLEQMPANAPSFYFIDIQNDQLPRFRALVSSSPGVESQQDVPSLRARIVAVNGVPAEQVQATEGTRWALRGDRGLTTSAMLPEGSRLVEGQWWPANYDGPPLVSLDAGLARGWGLGVGGTLRVRVLGRDIDLRVANLRDIAWRSLSLNFTLVASPGMLSSAPHMNIATVRVAPADAGSLLRGVTDALPNVTGIAVADVLAAIASLLGQLATALSAVGGLTLLAGALVLAGAVAAGQRRRVAEAVILKAVGGTRRQILTAWLVEFGILGIVAALLACAVGTAASWAVLRFVMHADWVFLPGILAITVAGATALMLLLGWAGTAGALAARAAPLLRAE